MAQTDKPLSIPVGFHWHNGAGKAWVVTGIRPGGICEVHRVGRYITGEMYARTIREAVAAGTAIPSEPCDEARKILRRVNG